MNMKTFNTANIKYKLALLKYIESKEIDVQTMRPILDAIKVLVMDYNFTFLVLKDGLEKRYQFTRLLVTPEEYRITYEKKVMTDFIDYIKDKNRIVVLNEKGIKLKVFN